MGIHPRINVDLQVLPHGADLPLPSWQTIGAAGADLCAAIDGTLVLPPLGRALVPCGFSMALPMGWEAQVRPRSGLAIHHGVTVLNAPGTIDADYRGEIKVALVNLGTDAYTVRRGDRIAQLVLAPVTQATWRVAETLDVTPRGEGGFGSTGA